MPPRIILSAGIAVGVAVAAVVGVNWTARGPGRGSADAHDAVDAAKSQLKVSPRGVEPLSEKAARVRDAIKSGEYSRARQIITDVLAKSQVQNWRFYPFDEFVNAITHVNDAALEAPLDAWVAQSKDDAIPPLIRAQVLP